MHAIHKATARQCNAISAQAGSADAHAFFNLLTGPELFDVVELALPPHRERVFPPTQTPIAPASEPSMKGRSNTWSLGLPPAAPIPAPIVALANACRR